MIVLALDLSTSTGYAWLNVQPGEAPLLLRSGRLETSKYVLKFGEYPFCYLLAAREMAETIFAMVKDVAERDGHWPEVVVIEEINLGKNRYSQKILEFIHCQVLEQLSAMSAKVVYLDSGEWRKNLGLVLTKEEKKANAKLSKAKREAAAIGAKLDKAALGIKGKVNKKHVALRYINERFGLELKVKDDDVADAICLGLAYANNAAPCDGT